MRGMNASLDQMGRRVVASSWLNDDVGELAGQWATRLLESGHQQDSILILSGETAPFHWSVIKQRVRAVVLELDMEWPETKEAAINMLAKTYVEELVESGGESGAALNTLKQICVDYDYGSSFYEFYSLWHAVNSLQEYGYNYYWDGLNLQNSQMVILDIAQRWLAECGGE